MSPESILISRFLMVAVLGFLPFGIVVSAYYIFSSERRRKLGDLINIIIILFALALLGACAGFAGGMSRASAVGDVIPAMFALLGGVSLYIFGLNMSRGIIASVSSACLALSLFLAYSFGSQLRHKGDEYRDLRNWCMTVYTEPDILTDPAALARFNTDLMAQVGFGDFCKSVLRWDLPDSKT